MLRNIRDFENCPIQATDGAIGHARDFYFDDSAWVIRYLVVDTGSWLSSRKVLISPMSISRSDPPEKKLSVSLSMEQVQHSPDIDTDKPISRQHEMGYLGYFGYPYYWGGNGIWGAGSFPNLMLTGIDCGSSEASFDKQQIERSQRMRECESDSDEGTNPHLRSCNAVLKYHIEADDGDIGHVTGFLVDGETWAIRYLIVETSNWWLGHQVLIVPQWIRSVSWLDHTVSVALSRHAVREAPRYESTTALDREQEARIYKHYDRDGYWTNQL